MGTDLHLLPEVRHAGGEWHPILNRKEPFTSPRDYSLFAILSDVRNGANWGTRTWQEPRIVTTPDGKEHDIPGFWYDTDDGGHERLVPISTPRGLPESPTPEWLANVLFWKSKSDDVIVSWLTLEEILAGPWDQVLIRRGLIDSEDYEKLLNDGTLPTVWSDQVGGSGLRIVSEEEYQAGFRGETTTVVDAQWTAGPMREVHASFLEMLQDISDTAPSSSSLRFMLLFES